MTGKKSSLFIWNYLLSLWFLKIVCFFVQCRDTCYVASPGLPELIYSGYKPHAYSWDDYPPLKLLLEAVSFLYFF